VFIFLCSLNARKIHRGEVLQAIVKRSDLSIPQIAKRTGYSRSSYYNHVRNPQLPLEILEIYGRAVGYDFSDEFPEMLKFKSFKEPEVEYLSVDQLKKDRDKWRDKYYELLERYHKLMEAKWNNSK